MKRQFWAGPLLPGLVALVVVGSASYAIANDSGVGGEEAGEPIPAAQCATADEFAAVGMKVDAYVGECPTEADAKEKIAEFQDLEAQLAEALQRAREADAAGKLAPEGQRWLADVEAHGGLEYLLPGEGSK